MPSLRFTYGFGRSTQLAALINGVLIAMAAAVVLVEAVQRLREPVPLVSGPVAWAAALGIASLKKGGYSVRPLQDYH